MAKKYFLGGEEITDEQREAAKKLSEEIDKNNQAAVRASVEQESTKILVTLEQLLKTRINPEEDRVLVWPDPVQSVTESGLLHKPEEAIKKEANEVRAGTVLSVGPGRNTEVSKTNKILLAILRNNDATIADNLQKEFDREKISLQPGDRIMFGRFAGTPVPDPDTNTEVLFMRPGDIFGKIRS